MDSIYVITNGRNWLKIGDNQKIMACSNIDSAKRFTFDKANNLLQNLPKSMKNLGWRLEPCKSSTDNIGRIYGIDSEATLTEMANKVKEFESYMDEISKVRDSLTFELSQVDAEIEDILHAAEFYKLNACEGYKLYKMLKDRRIKRRKLKNYIEAVGHIEAKTGKDFASGQGSKSILGMNNREYNPRVLKELFNR